MERFELSEFYVDTLMIFRRTVGMSRPISPSLARNEMLWLNREIKCNNQSLFDKNMYRCGIKYIGDIVSANGTIMQFTELKSKYPSLQINFLRFLSITSAIPRLWKNLLRDTANTNIEIVDRDVAPLIDLGDKQVSLEKMRVKDYYWLGRETVKPTAVAKWESKGFAPDSWSDIFNIPYSCTRSTKLQSFQYQIIHRYIPTRKFLSVRRIVDDSSCNRCNDVDTITHHLVRCPIVFAFWKSVFAYIAAHYSELIHPSDHNILFGIINAPPVVNLLIILAKHYIHARASQPEPLIFSSYMAYVGNVYETERRAAIGCSTLNIVFKEKWKLLPRPG